MRESRRLMLAGSRLPPASLELLPGQRETGHLLMGGGTRTKKSRSPSGACQQKSTRTVTIKNQERGPVTVNSSVIKGTRRCLISGEPRVSSHGVNGRKRTASLLKERIQTGFPATQVPVPHKVFLFFKEKGHRIRTEEGGSRKIRKRSGGDCERRHTDQLPGDFYLIHKGKG